MSWQLSRVQTPPVYFHLPLLVELVWVPLQVCSFLKWITHTYKQTCEQKLYEGEVRNECSPSVRSLKCILKFLNVSVHVFPAAGVSVLSSTSIVSAVFVSVTPNRPEFLKGESLSLSCGGVQDSSRWTVKRKDYKGQTAQCGGGFGFFDGSSCRLSDLSPNEDSGVYWCEDRNGQKSEELNIYVSGVKTHLKLISLYFLSL